ncbi:MAG TPA: GNAT family protein [Burkholderiaceae bacterium]|nr:GNAT family protein [Burkholderiaceae bacterium]
MIIATGPKVSLRLAELADRVRVYQWYAYSDLTAQMVGLPLYPDHPIPDFDTFSADYQPYFFDGTRPFSGRGLIIVADGLDIGFLRYDEINLLKDVVEIDLWFASRKHGGRGLGSEALQLACGWLQRNFGVNRFLLRPSRRNVHALRAMRRAGFRETDLDRADVIAKLNLPAGEYRDEVLLFRTLPLPSTRLVPEADRTYVFIDSEFTSLTSPRLISVGAVAGDAAAFYCELSDWPRETASPFVKSTVLPLLDGAAVPHPVAAESLVRWLGQRTAQTPVTLVSDSGFDRWALADLLGREDLPAGCDWIRVPIAYQQLDEVATELQLRRHHALDDARALRHVVLNAES